MKTSIFILTIMLAASSVLAGEGRYVKQHTLPDGRVAVVAEGDMEPRSIGSYAVRFYGAVNSDFPLDDFQGGIISRRNGFIERVELADIDGKAPPELIVVIRNAGSGSYLSADAFNCEGLNPVLATSVKDLAKDANLIDALRKAAAE